MNELTLTFEADKKTSNTILSSILPEIESDIHERSTIELMSSDADITLRITASDLHAMRAAANTYIRWLDMCVKLLGEPFL